MTPTALVTSEHVVFHSFAPSELLESVDFGFSFNVVTNLEGSTGTAEQGSLRGFLANANTMTGANAMRFVPVVPTNADDGGSNDWWSLGLSIGLPAITDDSTTVDGTAYNSADGTTVLATNILGPEFEIYAVVALADGIALQSSANTVRDFVINRFTTGIAVTAGDSNVIIGNYIGPDATGAVGQVGNSTQGIMIAGATNTTFGGATPADRNVISGNRQRGVWIDDFNDGAAAVSDGTVVVGNYIGTNAAGTAALPYNAALDSQQIGIAIWDGPDNIIGNPGNGNVLSGNSWYGVYIWGPNASGNAIQSNIVGLDATATNPVPNASEGATRSGIYISQAPSTLIGGTAFGAGNIVASNDHFGIIIQGATALDNTILSNSIYDNVDLGIELDLDGVTPNDPGDADTGPNDLLNWPVISSATELGGIITVTGSYDVPAGRYRFEFFTNTAADPSGNGEGQTFVGTSVLIHSGSGSEPFGAAFPGAVDEVITATVTQCQDVGCTLFDATSEFSNAALVVAAPVVFVVNSTGDTGDNVSRRRDLLHGIAQQRLRPGVHPSGGHRGIQRCC